MSVGPFFRRYQHHPAADYDEDNAQNETERCHERLRRWQNVRQPREEGGQLVHRKLPSSFTGPTLSVRLRRSFAFGNENHTFRGVVLRCNDRCNLNGASGDVV